MSKSNETIGKLWPPGQIQASAHERRMVWSIFQWLEKNSEEPCFMVRDNHMKFKFQGPEIKSCWNTASLICLGIVRACSGRAE